MRNNPIIRQIRTKTFFQWSFNRNRFFSSFFAKKCFSVRNVRQGLSYGTNIMILLEHILPFLSWKYCNFELHIGGQKIVRKRRLRECRFQHSASFYLRLSGVLHDKEEVGIGKSLFTHNNGQSSNSFFDQNFEPEFQTLPIIPPNV